MTAQDELDCLFGDGRLTTWPNYVVPKEKKENSSKKRRVLTEAPLYLLSKADDGFAKEAEIQDVKRRRFLVVTKWAAIQQPVPCERQPNCHA